MTEISIDDRIDRLIWRSIGRRSLRQVAEETGVPLEQLAFRRTELLDSVDELTIQQKRAKLLADLQEMADKASEDYDNEPDKDKGSKLLTAAIGATKAVLDQLSKMEKADTSKVEALNALRVRELVSLIQEAVDTSVPEIAKEYDIPEQVLFDIFNKNLGKAALKREIEG